MTEFEILMNLKAMWSKSDAMDQSDGMKAYIRYHDLFAKMAHEYKVTIEQAVGVFAALSPNNDYLNNLRGARTLLHWHGYRHPDHLPFVNVGTFHHAKERAIRVLRGEPFLSFSKGLKTRNFYKNIVDPTDPMPVTIDGHIYWAAVGDRDGQKQTMTNAKLSAAEYHKIAKAIRQLARQIGVLPNQVQAMIWFTRKRLTKTVYNDQLELGADRDGFQKTVYDLKDIRIIPQKEQTHGQENNRQ